MAIATEAPGAAGSAMESVTTSLGGGVTETLNPQGVLATTIDTGLAAGNTSATVRELAQQQLPNSIDIAMMRTDGEGLGPGLTEIKKPDDNAATPDGVAVPAGLPDLGDNASAAALGGAEVSSAAAGQVPTPEDQQRAFDQDAASRLAAFDRRKQAGETLGPVEQENYDALQVAQAKGREGQDTTTATALAGRPEETSQPGAASPEPVATTQPEVQQVPSSTEQTPVQAQSGSKINNLDLRPAAQQAAAREGRGPLAAGAAAEQTTVPATAAEQQAQKPAETNPAADAATSALRKELGDKLARGEQLTEAEMQQVADLNKPENGAKTPEQQLKDVEGQIEELGTKVLTGEGNPAEHIAKMQELRDTLNGVSPVSRERAVALMKGILNPDAQLTEKQDRRVTELQRDIKGKIEQLMAIEMQIFLVPQQLEKLREEAKKARTELRQKERTSGLDPQETLKRNMEVNMKRMQLANLKGEIIKAKNMGFILNAQRKDITQYVNSRLGVQNGFGAFLAWADAKATNMMVDMHLEAASRMDDE